MFGDKFADFEIFSEGFVAWTREFVIWGALCILLCHCRMTISSLSDGFERFMCFLPTKDSLAEIYFKPGRSRSDVSREDFMIHAQSPRWLTNSESLGRFRAWRHFHARPSPPRRKKSFLSQEENPSTFKNKTHLITVFTRWFDRTFPNEFMNRQRFRFSTSFRLQLLNVTKIFTSPLRLLFTSPFGSSLRALVCRLEEIFT